MTYTTRKGTYLSIDAPCGKNKIDEALDWLSRAFKYRTVEPALRVNDVEYEGSNYQYLTIEFNTPEGWERSKVDELITYYRNRFLNEW